MWNLNFFYTYNTFIIYSSFRQENEKSVNKLYKISIHVYAISVNIRVLRFPIHRVTSFMTLVYLIYNERILFFFRFKSRLNVQYESNI